MPELFTTVNPANEKEIAQYRYASEAEVEAALQMGHQSFASWRAKPLSERVVPLRTLATLLKSDDGDLARLMTEEMGKPLAEAKAELEKCALACLHYAEHSASMLADEPFENDRVRGKVVYEPLGPIYVIMPWNFPFWQVFRFVAPHLTAGNVGILKHAKNVAGCAAAIADLMEKAGYPTGVFQNLYADTNMTDRILADRRIAGVTLTGSTEAGKTVASLAGKHMKKGVYELGGSDPYIVFADADIENAAQQCAQARLLNSGQSCIAAKRFLVVDAVHDPFVEALTDAMRQYPMGDPRDEPTKIGPLARADLRDNLRRQVEQSLEAGAKLSLGGSSESPGYFYQPTILTDVKPGMPAFDEETFGPLAAVVRCNDEDEALELAAKTSFGLGSAIFSADVERAWELARHRLHAGNCAINTFVKSDPDAPFGGIKESGYGRELGQAGIREFMNAKTITVG